MNVELLRQSIRTSADVSFSRSGGPGGQNVNKVSTKVTLRVAFSNLMGLNEAELARAATVLAGRLADSNGAPELIVASSEERSQRVNLERAYARAAALITAAARLPKTRRPTRPSRAAREERLKAKRLHALKKAARRTDGSD